MCSGLPVGLINLNAIQFNVEFAHKLDAPVKSWRCEAKRRTFTSISFVEELVQIWRQFIEHHQNTHAECVSPFKANRPIRYLLRRASRISSFSGRTQNLPLIERIRFLVIGTKAFIDGNTFSFCLFSGKSAFEKSATDQTTRVYCSCFALTACAQSDRTDWYRFEKKNTSN